jgi:hypothetical protein
MTPMRRCLTTAGHPQDCREAPGGSAGYGVGTATSNVDVLVTGDRRIAAGPGRARVGRDPGLPVLGRGTASKPRLRRGIEPD